MEKRIGWSGEHIEGTKCLNPEALLDLLLDMRGKHLIIARLSVQNGLSKHVVGIDTYKGVIWDSTKVSYGIAARGMLSIYRRKTLTTVVVKDVAFEELKR